jgi:hypothetical protein
VISPFPPQFFLLLGVDIFLGGSIATVIFDQEFAMWLPYAFDVGAVAGFLQLYLVPNYLTGYPVQMQFYYSSIFAVIATMSVFGANLYLALVKHKGLFAGAFAVMATIPSVLALAYFVSAFVNGIVTPLPLFPIMPWNVVSAAFGIVTAIIVLAMLVSVHSREKTSGSTAS